MEKNEDNNVMYNETRDKQLKVDAMEEVERLKDKVSLDPFRLHFHIMPPVGLLNDPNGFIYFKGQYHLFYQWNPFATEHGAKFWGHYTSKDLVHWEEQPIALAPSDWFDKNGCYSGSAIEKDGKLILFYTGNVRDQKGNRESYQCMAISEDGIHFDKKGPVVTLPEGYTAHFRDPKVWQEKDGNWYMVIGAQTLSEEGCVVLYKSADLESWDYQGQLTGSNQNKLGDFGYMWECPDLFQLNGKDVLLFSPQGIEAEGHKYNNIYQTGYFVGEFDRDTSSFSHDKFVELDRGFDFYAPQTTVDDQNRRLLFGWMGLPEENEPYHPTHDYHWIHAMTIPRELKLINDKVHQIPVEELKKLRGSIVQENNSVTVDNQTVCLNGIVDHRAVEILLSNVEGKTGNFTMAFGDSWRVKYNSSSNEFTFERKSMKEDKVETRTCMINELNSLRFYIDTSSVELFINNGEEVFTSRVFDTLDDGSVQFEADGKITFDLESWKLKKVFK